MARRPGEHAGRTAFSGLSERDDIEGTGADETPSGGALSGRLPQRSAFPPSLFVLLAAGLALLAWEPTAGLGYALFGPARPVDLGGTGAYRLSLARAGERARIAGALGPESAHYTRHGRTWEVRQLLGTAVLVRRPPRVKKLGPHVVESFRGEGRLVGLRVKPSTFVDRFFDPDSRFDVLAEKFEETGALPPGRPVFLLLDGDLPRSGAWPLAVPFALWLLCAASLWGAVRSARRRRAFRLARAHLLRSL